MVMAIFLREIGSRRFYIQIVVVYVVRESGNTRGRQKRQANNYNPFCYCWM